MREGLDAAIKLHYGEISATQIGAVFGVSKNVIIGRAYRMGLSKPKRATKATILAVRLNVAPEKTPTAGRCCYIAGDVRNPDWRYCHAPTHNLAVDYCPEHRAIVWTKRDPDAPKTGWANPAKRSVIVT